MWLKFGKLGLLRLDLGELRSIFWENTQIWDRHDLDRLISCCYRRQDTPLSICTARDRSKAPHSFVGDVFIRLTSIRNASSSVLVDFQRVMGTDEAQQMGQSCSKDF